MEERVLIALVVGRLALFGIFASAGLAKLADRQGSREALLQFGVPRILAGPLGIILPLTELGTAIALLPLASAWWGGVGALVLLLLFIIVISINLARGRTPDCHCFGQLSSSPIGWSTLVRNLILAFIAGLLVWKGRLNAGASVAGWFADLTTSQRVGLLAGLAGLALLLAEGALLLQILRQQGRLLLRLDAFEAILARGVPPSAANFPAAQAAGLPLGTRAPGFRLDGLRGGTMTLDALLAENKPTLLVFTHPNCGPCESLMPDLAHWQRGYSNRINIALVSEGTLEDNRVKWAAHGVTQVLLQNKREVAEAYQVYGTPGAVLIRADGTIGSPLAQGADAIRGLFAQTAGFFPQAAAAALVPSVPQGGRNGQGHQATAGLFPLKFGETAPPVKLQDLDGKTVTLRSFRGYKTLLLFWNPSCGFCQQMLEDLKKWETDLPSGAPKLLVISTGTVEENRAMDLRSSVVLDHQFEVGSVFGAKGTPMAILLDAKGRIASEIAAGAQAVFALGGAKSTGRDKPGRFNSTTQPI